MNRRAGGERVQLADYLLVVLDCGILSYDVVRYATLTPTFRVTLKFVFVILCCVLF